MNSATSAIKIAQKYEDTDFLDALKNGYILVT